MTVMTNRLPMIHQVKQQAKQLRARLREDGEIIRHSQALELIARAQGFRDWNGLHAAILRQQPATWTAGMRVSGHYLSQPFDAVVVAADILQPGWVRLALHLYEPVDVIVFDNFSCLRQRIRGVIGPKGHSREQTSDGRPHLELSFTN